MAAAVEAKDGSTFIEDSPALEASATVEKTLGDAEVTGKLDSISTSMARQGTHTEHELTYLEALK
jgi:hypothetical protein